MLRYRDATPAQKNEVFAKLQRKLQSPKQPQKTNRLGSEVKNQADLRLGDHTERLLASIGVTKERYIAAKELFGLAPTCGCDKRKEWLNKVSDWWRGQSDSSTSEQSS